MDRFSFFFAFYGLVLGLAVAELLGGVGRLARARTLRAIGVQTALLALLAFMALCITWIDAFARFQNVTLDLSGLWAPILIATCYYLAAVVIFPTDEGELGDLDSYYQTRKTFVVAMLFAAETFNNVTFFSVYAETLAKRPAMFWYFLLPYNLAINLAFVALLLVKTRRANIGLLALLILLYSSVYWSGGAFAQIINNTFAG
jgi:hypothetical protein